MICLVPERDRVEQQLEKRVQMFSWFRFTCPHGSDIIDETISVRSQSEHSYLLRWLLFYNLHASTQRQRVPSYGAEYTAKLRRPYVVPLFAATLKSPCDAERPWCTDTGTHSSVRYTGAV